MRSPRRKWWPRGSSGLPGVLGIHIEQREEAVVVWNARTREGPRQRSLRQRQHRTFRWLGVREGFARATRPAGRLLCSTPRRAAHDRVGDISIARMRCSNGSARVQRRRRRHGFAQAAPQLRVLRRLPCLRRIAGRAARGVHGGSDRRRGIRQRHPFRVRQRSQTPPADARRAVNAGPGHVGACVPARAQRVGLGPTRQQQSRFDAAAAVSCWLCRGMTFAALPAESNSRPLWGSLSSPLAPDAERQTSSGCSVRSPAR
jgi:hypothetical protein